MLTTPDNAHTLEQKSRAWLAARPRRTITAPRHISNASTRGSYDGAELRPYQGRPGAMDAFALPSLMAGVRVWRRRP